MFSRMLAVPPASTHSCASAYKLGSVSSALGDCGAPLTAVKIVVAWRGNQLRRVALFGSSGGGSHGIELVDQRLHFLLVRHRRPEPSRRRAIHHFLFVFFGADVVVWCGGAAACSAEAREGDCQAGASLSHQEAEERQVAAAREIGTAATSDSGGEEGVGWARLTAWLRSVQCNSTGCGSCPH
jgi:hypothetical protein